MKLQPIVLLRLVSCLLVHFMTITGCTTVQTYPEPQLVGAQTEPGLQWTQHKAGEGRLFGIAWSGSQFVAVGQQTVRTSPDGLSWKPRKAIPSSNLEAVTWGGTQFVAVGGGCRVRACR